jgi:hypothetical protein
MRSLAVLRVEGYCQHSTDIVFFVLRVPPSAGIEPHAVGVTISIITDLMRLGGMDVLCGLLYGPHELQQSYFRTSLCLACLFEGRCFAAWDSLNIVSIKYVKAMNPDPLFNGKYRTSVYSKALTKSQLCWSDSAIGLTGSTCAARYLERNMSLERGQSRPRTSSLFHNAAYCSLSVVNGHWLKVVLNSNVFRWDLPKNRRKPAIDDVNRL